MKAAGVLLALAGALALQTTLAGLTIGGGTAVNLVLVAVVYAALAFGPVPGLLAGSAGGLVQDALAGGIIGIGGLSKTIVGFVVGVLGAQFIVSQTLPRLVMFVGATVVHELCLPGAVRTGRGADVFAALGSAADAGRRERPHRHHRVPDRGARSRGAAAPGRARHTVRRRY